MCSSYIDLDTPLLQVDPISVVITESQIHLPRRSQPSRFSVYLNKTRREVMKRGHFMNPIKVDSW
jgi:hypothetical protein